jgi:small subunit ribosomal protein S18
VTATPTHPQSETPTSPPKDSWEIAIEAAEGLVDSSEARLAKERQAALERNWTRADLEKQMQRRWRLGDVYAPHDLSGAEAAKWKKLRRKVQPRWDVLDQLGINPIHHYKVRTKEPRSG